MLLVPSHVAGDLPDGRVLRLPDFQFDHDGRAVGPTTHDIDTPHVALDLPPHERETLLKGVQSVHELIFDVPLEANRCLDGLRDLLRHVLGLVGHPQIRAVRLFLVQLERSVSELVEKAFRVGVMNVRPRIVDGAGVEVSTERGRLPFSRVAGLDGLLDGLP